MGNARIVMQRNRIKQCITLFSASLLLWLIWGFWSFGKEISYFFTAFIVLITIALCGWFFRRSREQSSIESTPLASFPPEHYRGAVIVVCGQAQTLFQGQTAHRETAKGWYICASSPVDLLNIIQKIIDTLPSQLSRLSLLYAVFPEQMSVSEDMTQELLNWRRAIAQCNKKVGKTLPFWVSLYLNPPAMTAFSIFNDNATSPWLTYRSNQQELQVVSDEISPQPLSAWLSTQIPNEEHQFAYSLWLDNLLAWLNSEFTPRLTAVESGIPTLSPSAWALRFTSVSPAENNSWAQFIQHKTGLLPIIPPTLTVNNNTLMLPDVLIEHLTHDTNLLQVETLLGISGALCGLFLVGALAGSYYHNKQLVYNMGNDIHHFNRLSADALEPKKVAYQQLMSDATLLSQWQREGNPARYSLALYQGNAILPYLHTVLSSWSPPPPPPPPAPVIIQKGPEMVTLDSLALFATGQYELKNEATKVLVDALINIKAKPGWLIVISGYTDNTGNPEFNQKLSLKRAEAVRDWMIKTSDIAPSCFAVQGYGQHQPVADNSTLDGRARNRRVEIRLIPQADACQVLADDLTPLTDGGN
ncbi:TPA: OmpA family protein [Proteus mirabilis]|nr:OmpA family protein [Proteus mirabilis]MBG2848724.1 OmpA family protein [Proteus mirabilis]MBG3007495.1 OmpA family protein [Proteus mirabilis]MBG3084721.1 OmpA family protein [Proteus mirabilis]MBG3088555.1 OmpA family protein [Proteus mirabilis]